MAGDLTRWEGDVVLADGGTVHIRPIRADDAPRLVALHGRLSRESRYLRFFSPMPTLAPSMVDRFVNVDYVDRMALVALLGEDIVGVARYETLEDDPSAAEVAFTVDDAHQGRGVGTVLLEHLAGVAADRGLTRFVADTLPDNTRMLNVFRSAGFVDERRFAGGVVRVAFPIAPTADSLAAVHGRERQAAAASVRRLLHPGSVAVVGAGRAPLGIGHEVFRNLLRSGFAGPVYPVNRAAGSVASVRAYPSILGIPDAVDLAIIAVPAAAVPAVVEECGQKGVAGLVVLSAGFADAGGDGVAAQRALVEQARGHGMRLLGPNSIGVANAAADVRLNASLAPALPPPGRVGFMAQSSALGVAIFEEARKRHIGVSTFVSAGNKADVSGNDLIQYWDEDPGTDVVLLYLESFGNPRTFARVARRLSRRKAVVAVKGGRSSTGRMVAGTPWAVPAGSEEVVDALFRHTGVLRVETLAQLLDVASVLAHQPLPGGRRIGIVANAGGSGVLVADACEGAGLVVPPLAPETAGRLRQVLGDRAAVGNPVTVVGTAAVDAYEEAVRLVLGDDGIDAVIVSFLPPIATPAGDVRRAVWKAAVGTTKPVVANFMTPDETPAATEREIPVFAFPEDAAQALSRAASLVEWRARPEGTVPVFDDVDGDAAAMIVRTALAEHPDGVELDPASAFDLLRAYRVPVAETRGVTSADEAMDAAAAIGHPVALKAVTGEHPAARLHLDTPAEVARAWDALALGDGPAVVQAMVPPGVETVVDVRTHPSFGPLVAFGTAGPAAEIYGDRALRVLPLTDLDADELIRSVKGAPLLLGYRGQPPTDLTALAGLLLRVSVLAQQLPEVAALTLEPVLVSASGATAVDVRIALAPYRAMPELALRRLR